MLNIRCHVTVLSFMHSIVPLNCVMYLYHIKSYTHDPRGIVLKSNMIKSSPLRGTDDNLA